MSIRKNRVINTDVAIAMQLGRQKLRRLGPKALFTIVLVCSPIGAGAMNNLWSAVGPELKAPPQKVELIKRVFN